MLNIIEALSISLIHLAGHLSLDPAGHLRISTHHILVTLALGRPQIITFTLMQRPPIVLICCEGLPRLSQIVYVFQSLLLGLVLLFGLNYLLEGFETLFGLGVLLLLARETVVQSCESFFSF